MTQDEKSDFILDQLARFAKGMNELREGLHDLELRQREMVDHGRIVLSLIEINDRMQTILKERQDVAERRFNEFLARFDAYLKRGQNGGTGDVK
jgi:hypothetical protein